MTTIETREQAETLPVETVLRLATGRVADRVPDGWTITGIYSPGPIPRGLYDTDLPATVLHDPTQPAPAGEIDREAAHRAGGQAYAEGGGPDVVVDAVLAVLPTRTVAQVKAEAWDEAFTEACCESCGCLRAKNVPNPYRADELEREGKR